MLDGMVGFLGDPRNVELTAALTDIYILAFRQRDLEDLSRILRQGFGQSRPTP